MINLSIQTTFKTTTITLQSVLIALLLLSISYAGSVPEPQQLMEDTSKVMLKKFINQTEAIRKDPDIALALINESLVPHINFNIMSKWVLGKNWKKATPDQQQQFIKEFQNLVIKFYSKAFIQFLEKNDLKAGIIAFQPFRGKINSKFATVRSQINPPSGAQPIKVNYDLYHSKKTGKWQVYDVSVEGISLVTTYRSSFNQIIKQKGMEALLSDLRDKNSKLDNPVEKNQVVGNK